MKAVHVITKTVTKANILRAQERRIHEDFRPNNFWMAFDLWLLMALIWFEILVDTSFPAF